MQHAAEFNASAQPLESTFAWKARDTDGSVCSGTMSAVSHNDVANRLRSDGRYVISIRESATGTGHVVAADRFRPKLNRTDTISFFRQISVMLSAGVSISEALDAAVKQAADSSRRSFLAQIQEEVESGDSFSSVLARRPRTFPLAILSLIKAAEATGSLDSMTHRAAQHLEQERRVIRQVKTALTYPAFMGLAGCAIIVTLLLFVLPRFASIYEARSATLPAPTKFLLNTSGFIREEWWWYLPLAIAGAVFIGLWSRTESARRSIEAVLLRLPVIRQVLLGAMVSRWTRTLSILSAAGVNLVDAVSILRVGTSSPMQQDLWDDVESSIRDGHTLSSSLDESPIVPPGITAMVAAGERSGRLSDVLETMADASEEDLDVVVKRTTSLLEPAMIVLLGLIVGFIALAMLMPIFGMSKVVSG